MSSHMSICMPTHMPAHMSAHTRGHSDEPDSLEKFSRWFGDAAAVRRHTPGAY